MKILVLYHTAWMEMMAHCWGLSKNIEVVTLPLPVADWDKNPELKNKLASLILDMAELQKPAFMLDVNGAGVLPLLDGAWTTQKISAPWFEWWWDDPAHSWWQQHDKPGWTEALRSSAVKHFIWDKTLAREYSASFGAELSWLPTATHPGIFSPAAAAQSKRNFTAVDLCFLGTLYAEPPLPDDPQKAQELRLIVSARAAHPESTYSEILASEGEPCLPLFAKALREADGLFSQELQDWRNLANLHLGHRNRNLLLSKIAESFESRFFAGTGWPRSLGAYEEQIYRPHELSACYQAATASLDLGNGQSFSGCAMRAYEIMCCGGILACDRKPDFDPEGKMEGSAYLRFSSQEELRELVIKLKSDSALASKIRASARDYAAREHNWNARLLPLLSYL